ncbi:MAG TPA: hypothetical protein VHZ74_10830 [Bryobacteraceae bacterium]|jgi:hypothetical protein|nr:hypothetical protein [Bryobacteraceae bacterium]
MTARWLKLLLVVTISSLSAAGSETANLFKGHDGPIYIESTLSYSATGGDHLLARARNDSGRPIQHFEICIGNGHGCLFKLWNTAIWKPDAVLNWDLDSVVHSKDLTQFVKLTSLRVEKGAPAPKQKIASSRPSFMQSLAIGLAAATANQPVPSAAQVQEASVALLLFGGEGHKVFLGCLNCSKFDANSVLNQFGQHGSQYATESVFNRYGEFGSAYSTYSACSQYATDPPVIVDQAGRYYGRMTVNRYNDPTRLGYYAAWIAGVCQR